ncbi:hypothetical protein DF214_08125 [Pectobacterium atrosepticum]|nr:hypothetical protein CVS35_09380 [Pectobacterium atrosepticum]PWD62200.1 hypothetical protein DF214_08125 [Pectobacterium atrosepticum]
MKRVFSAKLTTPNVSIPHPDDIRLSSFLAISCYVPVILQAACALAAFKYSARGGPCPEGPTLCVVQNANVLSCNSNYFGYSSKYIRVR